MAAIKKTVFLIFAAYTLSFCGSKQCSQMGFPQEITAVYFQKAIDSVSQTEARTVFYIEFKKPLKNGIILEKVYFRNQVALFKKENDTIYKAYFYPIAVSSDLVLDSDPLREYGNKAPQIASSKFNLESSEGVVEYKNSNTRCYYKLMTIKERAMIPSPSGIKPKN